MGNDICISVALVTRNRPDSLRRCLESLRAQSAQPFEVVVSDDSDDSFIEKTRVVAEEFGCRYQAGPRRGLYANRNAAALACTGTHIRTMDDDHTFPPGHFAQCLAAVASDPGAIWTTGEITMVDGGHYWTFETAGQLHPAGVGCAVDNSDDNWAIADGSTIYPRTVFDDGFRMVEDFGYGPAYLEFGAFLRSRGYRSRCVRGALVEHHADKATLRRRDGEARLFASLCFNLHFRPSALMTARHVVPQLLRSPRLFMRLPGLLKKARDRWGSLLPGQRPASA
jgi:glycosyltransferase involved in cell wall biosynthesis